MKIRRFSRNDGYRRNDKGHLRPYGIHSYAYIWANWCERREIDKMISDGRNNIRKHPLRLRGSSTVSHYIMTVEEKVPDFKVRLSFAEVSRTQVYELRRFYAQERKKVATEESVNKMCLQPKG